MRMITIYGSRQLTGAEGLAVRLAASQAIAERQQRKVERIVHRNRASPERLSVAKAIFAVEDRLVRAFWTIARQPAGTIKPVLSARCGIEYLAERGDLNGYSDAAGGKWDSVAPRPPIPSGKDIDDAVQALDWLLFLDDARRKLLVAGATSKRGDVARQINWMRLRTGMPELAGLTTRTCQGRYRESLRIIVTELTLAHLAR
jgi:hypothetical protein